MKFPSMNVLTNHQSASMAEFARMITTRLPAIVGAVPLETTSLVWYPNFFFLVIDPYTYPNFCPLFTKNKNI